MVGGDAALARMGLDKPSGLRERAYRALLRGALEELEPLERIVDVAGVIDRLLVVRCPFGVEIGERACIAITSCSVLPSLTSFSMRSREVTSMSRNSATSALVASGPWPTTILVLSLATLR